MNSSDAMPRSNASSAGQPPLEWASRPDKVGRLLADIEGKLDRKRRRRARTVRAAAGVLVLAAIGFWAVPYARDTEKIATAAAHRETVALADGSTAELNARTEVRTDFRYGRRTLRLDRGEVYLEVAKDPRHPFLVETPGGVVRVTGTRFNVRLGGDGKPEVTLFEGAVGLQRDGVSFLNLLPGQQFDGTRNEVHVLSKAELANVRAWQEGRLVLDGLTLGEAVNRMAAYHGREIEVAAAVASYRMGGSCALDDLDGFLAFLPRAVSVQVVPRGNGSFRILAR